MPAAIHMAFDFSFGPLRGTLSWLVCVRASSGGLAGAMLRAKAAEVFERYPDPVVASC